MPAIEPRSSSHRVHGLDPVVTELTRPTFELRKLSTGSGQCTVKVSMPKSRVRGGSAHVYYSGGHGFISSSS
jgi:hypothetical protein